MMGSMVGLLQLYDQSKIAESAILLTMPVKAKYTARRRRDEQPVPDNASGCRHLLLLLSSQDGFMIPLMIKYATINENLKVMEYLRLENAQAATAWFRSVLRHIYDTVHPDWRPLAFFGLLYSDSVSGTFESDTPLFPSRTWDCLKEAHEMQMRRAQLEAEEAEALRAEALWLRLRDYELGTSHELALADWEAERFFNQIFCPVIYRLLSFTRRNLLDESSSFDIIKAHRHAQRIDMIIRECPILGYCWIRGYYDIRTAEQFPPE